MDPDIRAFLQRIANQLGEQVARFDALDANVQRARAETEQFGRAVGVLAQEFRHLTDAVGMLAEEIHNTNERVDRMMQAHVRARTDEVERYMGLDARLTAVETQVHTLVTERAR